MGSFTTFLLGQQCMPRMLGTFARLRSLQEEPASSCACSQRRLTPPAYNRVIGNTSNRWTNADERVGFIIGCFGCC